MQYTQMADKTVGLIFGEGREAPSPTLPFAT